MGGAGPGGEKLGLKGWEEKRFWTLVLLVFGLVFVGFCLILFGFVWKWDFWFGCGRGRQEIVCLSTWICGRFIGRDEEKVLGKRFGKSSHQ